MVERVDRADLRMRLTAALIDGALILPAYFALSRLAAAAVGAGVIHGVHRFDPVFLSLAIGSPLVLAYGLLEVLRRQRRAR